VEYSEYANSQCHSSMALGYPATGNPLFKCGLSSSVTGDECRAACNDESNVVALGRGCVGYEHYSQNHAAVAGCWLAWGCDSTEYFGLISAN